MNIKFVGTHKSLTSFEWNNIPPLTIITGLNGVGKSQLLGLLNEYYHSQISSILYNNVTSKLYKINNLELTIDNLDIIKQGSLFWQSNGIYLNFEGPKFGYKDLEPIVSYIHERIKGNQVDLHSLQDDEHNSGLNRFKYVLQEKWDKIVKEIESRTNIDRVNLQPEVISYFFPEEILLEDYDLFAQDSLDLIFFFYLYKKLANEKYGLNIPISSEAPWDILNKVINEAGLPYQVTYPSEELIKPIFNNALARISTTRFNVELIHPDTKEVIGFNNISSGERVILSLALLLYYSQNRDQQRKILLLDEPDSHLHPSLTKQLFDVIYKVIIKQYNGRVIMTTHSPSTIAIAPEEADCKIFEMKKNPTTIEEVSDRARITSILSDGLIIVSPSSRYVLVEGKNDKPFFEKVYKTLLTERKIDQSPTLVFIPGTNKDSVNHFTTEFSKAGLSEYKGIIDLDYGNTPDSDAVHLLDRYSIENYLLDPILIFLTTPKQLPQLAGIPISKGYEHLVRQLSETDLQLIADVVLAEVIPDIRDITAEMSQSIEIEYISGKKINLPKWLLHLRGKSLLPKFQDKFGGGNHINHPNLILNLSRTGLIPIDLVNLFFKIQDKL